MDVSGREVGEILGLGQSQTTRLLASGLAGPGHRRGRSVLYDAAAVAALRDRPLVTEETPLPPACGDGVLLARVDPRGAEPGAWRELASGPWRLAFSRVLVLLVMRSTGPVPLVATVAGFVLGGAEVIDGRHTPEATTFELAEPGDWFDAFSDTRVPAGPGEPLLFWRCRWSAPMGHRRTTGLPVLGPVPPRHLRPVRPARPRATAG
ncbi:hypothetical protein [Nocardioides taihuensis]|uniref:Uncharacterized protein n=1 Tax=Nocardioides taihuensis TaxID=1835606 RepID=A0ABW0BP28_9ACTN